MKMRNLHHYIQDYMGNNRMVVNRDGAIEQITHYYPYGPRTMVFLQEGINSGKILQKELDKYTYYSYYLFTSSILNIIASYIAETILRHT